MFDLWQSFAVHRISYVTPWAFGVIPLSIAALAAARFRGLSPHLRHSFLWIALLGFFLPPILPYFMPTAGEWVLQTLAVSEWSHRTVKAAGADATTIAQTILCLHLLGWGALAVRLSIDAWRLHRLHGAATTMERGPLYGRYLHISKRLGISRPPRLLVSSDASVPFISGVFRPAITIPLEMAEGLSEEAASHVLAHELIHHRSRDVWLNVARLTICSLWFFHPVVWMVGRAITDVREECCDAAVIANLAIQPREYSNTLLDAAELAVDDGMLAFSTGIFGRPLGSLESLLRWVSPLYWAKNPLENRLTLLASTNHPSPGLASWQRVSLLVVALFVFPPAPGKSEALRSPLPDDARENTHHHVSIQVGDSHR